MTPAAFLEEAGGAHLDSGIARHPVECVFDGTVAGCHADLERVAVRDAVQFEQPVLEALAGLDLARPNLVGLVKKVLIQI